MLRVMAKSNASLRYPSFTQNIYKKENTGIRFNFVTQKNISLNMMKYEQAQNQTCNYKVPVSYLKK